MREKERPAAVKGGSGSVPSPDGPDQKAAAMLADVYVLRECPACFRPYRPVMYSWQEVEALATMVCPDCAREAEQA